MTEAYIMATEDTATQPVTAEDLERLPTGSGRYALINGELRTIPPAGGEHGSVTMHLAASLYQAVSAQHLGRVYAAETGFLLAINPDTVLAPDAAFIRQERVEPLGNVTGFIPAAPDLAVEVISLSDTYTEVEEKVALWLRHGTQMVVVVNPRRRGVTVYRPGRPVLFLTEEDELSGNDVLPGWTIRVRDLFR
jgi:Uma2 family endonuclease